MKLDPQDSLILIVDVQARLGAAMPPERYAAVVKHASHFLAVSAPLEIPVIVSEQYPKGLGPTDERLSLPTPAFAKTAFSAWWDEAIRQAIQATARRSVILLGMETHICVYQTARDLAAAGLDVHVMADGVASRTEANRQIGLDLMRAAGCTISSTETALFDLLGTAGGPVFKQVSRMIR